MADEETNETELRAAEGNNREVAPSKPDQGLAADQSTTSARDTIATPSDADHEIVIFVDGTCLFCNGLVVFLLRRDARRQFRFAHVQGETARRVLSRHDLEPDIDIIYAVTGHGSSTECVWMDGEAGRKIWPRIYRSAILLRFVPLWLLNLQYRLFARIRYRLFGQADACVVPTAEHSNRFLP